jgi:thioredoxin
MTKIIHVNSKEAFNREVILASDTTPVLVDFWADWCAPCKAMNPILDKFAAEHPEIRVVKVDTERDGGISEYYDVSSIPTMMLFMDRGPRTRIMGARSYGYLESDILGLVRKWKKKANANVAEKKGLKKIFGKG